MNTIYKQRDLRCSNIDLSTPENKEKWCKYFNCSYRDILDVIVNFGNNRDMVKLILDLNKSKRPE